MHVKDYTKITHHFTKTTSRLNWTLFTTITIIAPHGRCIFATVYMSPCPAPHALYHIWDIT